MLVKYFTAEEMTYQLLAIERVQDYHKSNEGIDEKDALILCLDKSIITEYEYDMIYPVIMSEGLYGQLNTSDWVDLEADVDPKCL